MRARCKSSTSLKVRPTSSKLWPAAVLLVIFAAPPIHEPVLAQSSSPQVVVSTQLGISPGAPTPAEQSDTDKTNAAPPGPAPAQQPAQNTVAVATASPAAQPAIRAASAGLKTQVAEDTTNLVKLANSLKAEVDKTTKDTLSVTVVRQAAEIEQLAHKMRSR